MKKRRLIVFTDSFPYGNGESFIESECVYWIGFDSVIVCPLSISDNQRTQFRSLPEGIEILDLNYRGLHGTGYILPMLRALLSADTWKDLMIISKLSNKKIAIRQLFSLLANVYAQYPLLKKKLRNYPTSDELVLYAYWLYAPALMAVILRRTLKPNLVISRAHGFDIYEERRQGYLPFRKKILSQLDIIAPISENGTQYLKNKYPKSVGKCRTLRLGTKDYGVVEYKRIENTIRIVSCAYCSQLKRINLIIDCLAALADIRPEYKLVWTHFGAGDMFINIKDKSNKTLTGKVEYQLVGNISNERLMHHYKYNAYDVFLNVSSTEGIPVSIMESMSFGTPVIATDVGGTSELVKNGESGFLLDKDFSVDDLAAKIIALSEMPLDEYLKIRKNARNYWYKNFSAEKNYSEFVNVLKGGKN